MGRKRSSFNILKDDSISSTPNQPSAEDFTITTRKRRTKVQCFCSKCNGNLVDPRTKKAHDKKSTLVTHLAVIPPEETQHSAVIPPEETPITQVFIEPTIERHSAPTISDSDVDDERTIIFIPRKKRVKTNTLRHITNEIIENDDSNGNVTSDNHSDEFSEYSNDDGDDDGMITGMMMETKTNFLMFLKIIHILHLTCQKFQNYQKKIDLRGF
jgi:hypothetical protein